MKKNSFFHRLDLFLRSLLFSIVTLISAVTWSPVCVAAFFTPVRFRCRLVYGWTNFVIGSLKIICKVNYRIDGLENIPKDRNGVILCKHQSTWETFFFPGFFLDPAIILKRELKWLPFFGWALAMVEPIAINRSKTSTAMGEILKQGKKNLDRGRWVLMFPEGTRVTPGHVGKYRVGGARLAVTTGYPVLPIAHNAGCFWSKRKFIKKPGTIQVAIGPLIETKGMSPEDVLVKAKEWIEKTMTKIDGGRDVC